MVKLIAILIAIGIMSVLIVLWINLTLKSTNQAVSTVTNGQQGTGENYSSGSPIEYSEQKANELNEMTEERAKKYNDLP